VRQFGVAANGFADIQAIGVGQHDVQKDQVRPLAPAEVKGTLTGLRANQRESLLFKVVLQEGKQVNIVLNQKDFLHYNQV
jgi:hypothetical protein